MNQEGKAVAAEVHDPNLIKVNPAKRFFVDMLTRDIDLEGAILDLLDNCIDGALRTNKRVSNTRPIDPNRPYEGYWAHINLSPEEFSIEDNCGGIDKDTAQLSAFKFGREDEARDQGLATVGLYGIGMKRAIFKIGDEAIVKTKFENTEFDVEFTKDWIQNQDDWNLHLKEVIPAELQSNGTRIQIRSLKPNIQIEFNPEKNSYKDRLIRAIHNTYSLLIKKGFSVKVNNEPVKIKPNDLVLDPDAFDKKGVTPYAYFVENNGVSIDLVMGMYSKLPDFADDEYDEKGDLIVEGEVLSFIERSKHNAGWTVICNDRVILSNDTTEKTGWALPPITPNFHTQYAAIGGYVIFNCDDPKKLPLTTTKREIDQGSVLFMQVKEEMKLAIKTMVAFTNDWKSPSEARDAMQETVRPYDVLEIRNLIPHEKFKPVQSTLGGMKYKPDLPKRPKNPDAAKKLKIQFSKDRKDVEKVKQLIFGDEDYTPNQVGEECFNLYLAKAN